jgi:hypothetical protein
MPSNQPKKVTIYVEQHQGQLYAWRKKDHKFLGQGPDKESLFERLAEDIEGIVVFLCAREDGGELLLDK